ncbi:MAG: carbamoyl-phosphate synthase large subunit [Planctomycetes bacterium]|nr:carbamoyl-phosphate synthase large subunit [Planctomycetota bacterium]
MPRRDDIQSILLLGSGPIVIGQACEFDYSGTQACKALREEGYRVVLVNSNPATIMTDPGMADATYIEPLTIRSLTRILEKERPDALLPTLGGQTALNLALQLADLGVLDRLGVEMIGATRSSIAKAEGREEFRSAMQRIGLESPRSGLAYSLDEAKRVLEDIGLPCVIRPSYTLGGSGGGIAYNHDEFEAIARLGLDLSLNSEILVEESVLGWKEYELEVMRDKADNCVIICSIENLDPMGVHTGDSITVAPAQTLSDKEYQLLRDATIAIMREIGVSTGGSNCQYAIDPKTGRMVVIEMNPRVSRSSALASKATGFPIAKIAAKLAVGYTLDEITNDITKKTPACFEPSIDYTVVKIPRWAFEKFPLADKTLGTQMKSVGEVMAIGRTFKEAFQKAMRGLETGYVGFGGDEPRVPPWGNDAPPSTEQIRAKLVTPRPSRLKWIHRALWAGISTEDLHDITKIDPWFLDQCSQLVEAEKLLAKRLENGLGGLSKDELRGAKRLGFSNRQIAGLAKVSEGAVKQRLSELGLAPVYKLVDTCAAEFESYTPYYYSTWEDEDELHVSDKKRIVILGGGPNRIGQGIEFDYCCCHAAFALAEDGYETVMVNSNPETVSTDFDTSDLLFFEPLTHEDVLHIVARLNPVGVIVQFGGQTPINLAKGLSQAGVPLLGTPLASIDTCEDRELFQQLLRRLDIRQPENGIATDVESAFRVAREVGYPVVVRPSYVLGGRAMQIVYDDASLEHYMNAAVRVGEDKPILIDKFLEDAIEVDVDLIGDGETYVIGGIMEHIEEAGVHSGDSCCSLPPYSLADDVLDEVRRQTLAMAKALEICGLMNVQFAIKGDRVYVLEVNPRASRTVPFVAKAIGVPLAKLAARVQGGMKLQELGFTEEVVPEHFSVKAPVFPFNKFPGVDTILGPEMRSTGEVMGIDENFGAAFAKAMEAADVGLPKDGKVFLSVKDSDKREICALAARLSSMGFGLVATAGTYKALRNQGLPVELVNKIHEGRPHVIDLIKNRQVGLIINTPSGNVERSDDRLIRSTAVSYKVPCLTNLAAAASAILAMQISREDSLDAIRVQDLSASVR